MAKSMTYAEQLKHPNWQRKRLEMLDAAGWECSNCGDKDCTLHVHHKLYIKGRKAWEYSHDELAVLCEVCHERTHVASAVLQQLLSKSNDLSGDVGLMAGYHMADDWIERDLIQSAREINPYTYAVGFIAYLASGLYMRDDLLKVIQFIGSLHEESSEFHLMAKHDAKAVLGLEDH